MTIIPCDYLNLSLANEYVGDVTIPSQVIDYNQTFPQANDQPIRLQYLNQIKLFLHDTTDKYKGWNLEFSFCPEPGIFHGSH